uniref:Immunoglobulin superfamily, member 8 n=1 Tax=Nothobranchius furzeri TaxID=105023 RepID=A0A8C6MJ47_NOTFU
MVIFQDDNARNWALIYAVCRDVTLPTGPLFRVAGFPLSLPCQVFAYEGSRTQDFEWFLYRDNAGGMQMGVVSTRDPGLSYAPFSSRVRNGEVRVERDSGDKVRLVIQRLRAEDQGKYECYTPSTDSKYLGNYSASVTKRSLTGQPVPEGAELTLTCLASIQSEQLTHLSITFGKRDGEDASGDGTKGEVREIISIDKLLGVIPGQLYKTRYDDGEITLEKRNGEGGQGVYVMKMMAVQPEDSGSYFCEASQWIRDPDRSWQKIAQRTLDIGNLTVQQLAKSLSVTSSPQGNVTLQIGSPLILTCEVLGLPSEVSSGLQVQWMKRGSISSDTLGNGVEVEVARMRPDGIVSWGDDLSRASGGSMEKVAERKYSLKLFSARPLDSGVYRCVVSVYASRNYLNPSMPAMLTQRSEDVTVNLKTKDVFVSAVAELPRGPLLKPGSTISLICNTTIKTTGPTQAQVQWFRWPLPKLVTKAHVDPLDPPGEKDPTLIAALMYSGIVNIYVNNSEISVDRLSADSYRLRVHMASIEDQGLYVCHSEAWGQDPHGGWYNTGSKAQSNAVTVYLYSRATDLLLIPLVVGVSSALFVGIVIIAAVTCCFMKRLARQRTQK